MKPWIAKETAAKVTIMGSDFRPTLLELIDEDALPARLGGKCTCDGLGGCMKSNAGPWMHERKLRREAWLADERDTMAILPGELSGPIQVKRPEPTPEDAKPTSEEPQAVGDAAVPKSEVPEAAASEQAATPPESMSETSSVESSSLGTPPPSEVPQNKAKVEALGEDANPLDSEQPKVVTVP